LDVGFLERRLQDKLQQILVPRPRGGQRREASIGVGPFEVTAMNRSAALIDLPSKLALEQQEVGVGELPALRVKLLHEIAGRRQPDARADLIKHGYRVELLVGL
jgi:hypothetical protein